MQRTAASGKMAMKLKAKRRGASQSNRWEVTLRGTNTRKTFNHEPKKKNRADASQEGCPTDSGFKKRVSAVCALCVPFELPSSGCLSDDEVGSSEAMLKLDGGRLRKGRVRRGDGRGRGFMVHWSGLPVQGRRLFMPSQ